MLQKLKQIGCCLLIIVLLPYVLTVFISGPEFAATSSVDDRYVKVRTQDENGEAQISIEDYCIGILAGEIPPEYDEEALKAQAVLVRTEVYAEISREGMDAVLSIPYRTQKQMEESWGAARYYSAWNKMKNAWKETEGQVLMYEGELARTAFCRLTNGSTRDGKEVLGEDVPYLKIVECPLDVEEKEQIQTFIVEDMDAEIVKCDTAGYVLLVDVGGEQVSGEQFRENYDLPSSCFAFQKYNGKLRITTRGVGHGLGMSQNTANRMAKEGKDHEEILNYFFEGTNIKEVADIVK